MPSFRRREKVFGRDHGRPLNKFEKRIIRKSIEKFNKTNKCDRQHIGPITRTYTKVAEVLLYQFHNSKTGLCFPSYEAIAEKAECARSTVHKALQALERAGILKWVHRLAHLRLSDSLRRVVRTSNAYIFQLPHQTSRAIHDVNSESENRIGTLKQDSSNVRRPCLRSRQEDVPHGSAPGYSTDEDARESALKQLEQLGELGLLKKLRESTLGGNVDLVARHLMAGARDQKPLRKARDA